MTARSEATGAQKLAGRRLYLCVGDRPDLARFVSACIRGGVDVVQLRDKRLDARALLKKAAIVREVCDDAGVLFILNDRPDLALESGADGVHVGQDDAPARLARRILGESAVVGLSTHAQSELEASKGEPVDYISVGPVEPTPTKPGRSGTGIEYVELAARSCERPFFVTGGVTPEKIKLLANAGASRFVAVRYLTEAPDPTDAARRLRQAIDESCGA